MLQEHASQNGDPAESDYQRERKDVHVCKPTVDSDLLCIAESLACCTFARHEIFKPRRIAGPCGMRYQVLLQCRKHRSVPVLHLQMPLIIRHRQQLDGPRNPPSRDQQLRRDGIPNHGNRCEPVEQNVIDQLCRHRLEGIKVEFLRLLVRSDDPLQGSASRTAT